jgi:hypothetical protein
MELRRAASSVYSVDKYSSPNKCTKPFGFDGSAPVSGQCIIILQKKHELPGMLGKIMGTRDLWPLGIAARDSPCSVVRKWAERTNTFKSSPLAQSRQTGTPLNEKSPGPTLTWDVDSVDYLSERNVVNSSQKMRATLSLTRWPGFVTHWPGFVTAARHV